MILSRNMFKRVGESRHPCRTPTVVRNQSPMLLFKRTALVAVTSISIFLYAYESWTLTAELQRRMQAMEMRFYCKILRISYKDHATTRKSVPRSSRQSDHTKTPSPSYRDANCSSMVMSPVLQVWPKPSCKAQ